MGATVLVLREEDSARRTADLLRRRGHAPVCLPLERIEATGEPPPPGAWSGFCITSAHAVAPLAGRFASDPRPVFAVGEASAKAALDAGFPAVLAGRGAAEDLGADVLAHLGAGGGPLLYAAGEPRTGTLEAGLQAAGLGFRAWDVYRTVALEPRAEAFAASGAARANAVLVLSVGQATGLLRLFHRLPGTGPGALLFLCLSPRIAAALGPLGAGRTRVPAAPRLDALLDLVDA
ncbi:uroporphyrinogen-III synthase [Antarcticirhabdus aurantiaca]|uniref:Uroporphyrinogen-III synthase n=1 Tax=Antarcticirhabdus aurantiaca TaxID=2606717 RepID=A0ACD4NKV8_9HYPH|nr:uroporphyrinogen-III synthase [Antarcticirhabdus aurantiaca]WAJ27495.1 uroporphyrinogen-III synthase [Jeongeuplla avenae]